MDYPKLYEGFPGVKIRGGISYFLWDREHAGPCEVQTIWDGQRSGPVVARYLDAYDILVRRNEAIPILEKVRAKNEPTLDARVSSQKPFGLRTFFHGKPDPKRLEESRKALRIPEGQLGRAVGDSREYLMDRQVEGPHDSSAGDECRNRNQVPQQADHR